MPKVSICIPAYEQPAYFRRTLTTVLEQSYRDFEVVVTDDSRSEDVYSVCSDLGDSRVRYVKNPTRRGPPANWNAAVELARGEMIKVMHHDDSFVSEDSLRRFVRLLEATPAADLAFSASVTVDADQRATGVYAPLDRIEQLRRDPAALLVGNWIGPPSATIFRRSVTTRFDETLRWVVDLDFYLAVLMRNPVFAYDANPLVRVTGGAAHQVTADIANDPDLELSEWFRLYGRWAPRRPLRGERREWISGLIRNRRLTWRDYKALRLDGRSARVFAAAVIRRRLGWL
jgi:glycosyltransferase involved in cell wall biosynthesis